MRFFAAMIFLWPSFCDRRVTTEFQPPTRTEYVLLMEACDRYPYGEGYGTRTVISAQECRHVVEIYERLDGVRYTKESDECLTDYFMKGPCV